VLQGVVNSQGFSFAIEFKRSPLIFGLGVFGVPIVKDHSAKPGESVRFAIFCKRLQTSVTNGRIAVSESISHLGFPPNPFFVSYFSSSPSFVALLDKKKKKT
jgi:hypothetical protein